MIKEKINPFIIISLPVPRLLKIQKQIRTYSLKINFCENNRK